MQHDLTVAATALPTLKEVPGHYHPVPFLLTLDTFGGLPIEMAGGEISHLVNSPVADMHMHEVPEIYLLLSPEPGGAVIEIDVEGEQYVVESPIAVYIPAKMRHRFITRKAMAGSYCLGILLNKI